MIYRVAASLLVGSLSRVSRVSAFQSSSSSSHNFIISKGILPHFSQRPITSIISLPAMPSFCEMCGSPTQIKIPDGDERERSVCTNIECGHVTYQNPKIVVGAICTYKDKVLLCQRNIEPCKGKWGYPQGFLELKETTRQGAARECYEEAGVKFDASKAELLALYNLAGMQIQTIYRVELESDTFKAGHESSDVKFVDWDYIPWNDLAFTTVEWGLAYAKDMRKVTKPPVQERTKLITEDGKWEVEEG